MKKHYFFVSGIINCNLINLTPEHLEAINLSGAFELVQGEVRENKFPLEESDDQFFLGVPTKLEELLKEKCLQKYKSAKIHSVQLYCISRLN